MCLVRLDDVEDIFARIYKKIKELHIHIHMDKLIEAENNNNSSDSIEGNFGFVSASAKVYEEEQHDVALRRWYFCRRLRNLLDKCSPL